MTIQENIPLEFPFPGRVSSSQKSTISCQKLIYTLSKKPTIYSLQATALNCLKLNETKPETVKEMYMLDW